MNLRWPYNGETSGSLMRILAKGKCVVVNDVGSFSEIPGECCCRLPSVEELSEGEEEDEISKAMLRLAVRREERERLDFGKIVMDLSGPEREAMTPGGLSEIFYTKSRRKHL